MQPARMVQEKPENTTYRYFGEFYANCRYGYLPLPVNF